MVSLALVITISNASGLFRRSDLSAAYALVGVSDPLLGLTHSREVHHSASCVFNKPLLFTILVVIIRISIRDITTYNSRLIYRLLPIVS